MATLLMTALATGLMLAAMTEAAIASSHRDALVTLYAAEAAAERTIEAVRDRPDWQTLPVMSARWTYPGDGGPAVVTATASSTAPGTETLELTAEATGPQESRRTVRIVIARDNPPVSGMVKLTSWVENP
jgi:hypothetical protein